MAGLIEDRPTEDQHPSVNSLTHSPGPAVPSDSMLRASSVT